jgi:acetone carboxylase, gamma subunit
MSYPTTVIRDLIDGRLPWSQTHQIMSAYKDTDRFDRYLEILQGRVAWPDQILLPLTDRLFIVEADEHAVVKCECGHVFGDYTENWKLAALINVRRSPAAVEEIYGPFGCDPEWMELREFICPGCVALLEVEAAVPGYPVVFDFQPDLLTFYREWLDREPPAWLAAATA